MEKKQFAPLVYNIDEYSKMWNGELVVNKQDPETGEWKEVVFRNQCLLGGLQRLAERLYGKPAPVKIHTFEHDLAIGAVKDEDQHVVAEENAPYRVMGFNLITDGGQGDAILPYPRYKCGYDFDHLIPFRMIPVEENDYSNYRNTYLHSRVVELDGRQYVQYFTKKCDITLTAKLDDGTSIPNYPNEEFSSDKDARVIAEFPINISDDELVEWFRLTKQGGAKATMYNGVITMDGKPAKWQENGTGPKYDAMKDTLVMSRCPCAPIPHGVDGTIIARFRTLHI